jgi:colanic acid biosynthesis glycosyl transferase WcaI
MILSQYYDPKPVAKPGELARALRDRDHETAIVIGFPNYPSGKLYDGYRLRLIQREQYSRS